MAGKERFELGNVITLASLREKSLRYYYLATVAALSDCCTFLVTAATVVTRAAANQGLFGGNAKLPGGQDTAASVVSDPAWCTDASRTAVTA